MQEVDANNRQHHLDNDHSIDRYSQVTKGCGSLPARKGMASLQVQAGLLRLVRTRIPQVAQNGCGAIYLECSVLLLLLE